MSDIILFPTTEKLINIKNRINKLSDEQKTIILQDDFELWRLEILLDAIEQNYDLELVKIIANNDLEKSKVFYVCNGIIDNFSKEQILLFAKKDLSIMHMQHIYRAIKFGLSNDIIKQFADNSYEPEQIRELVNAYIEKIPQEMIDKFLNKEFSAEQMLQIRQGIRNKIPYKYVLKYANNKFNEQQMKILKQSFNSKDIDNKDVCLMANELYDKEKMECLYEVLLFSQNNKYFKMLLNPEFSFMRMEILKDAIMMEFSDFQINALANQEISDEKACRLLNKMIENNMIKSKTQCEITDFNSGR